MASVQAKDIASDFAVKAYSAKGLAASERPDRKTLVRTEALIAPHSVKTHSALAARAALDPKQAYSPDREVGRRA
jgi:hypothetical protein